MLNVQALSVDQYGCNLADFTLMEKREWENISMRGLAGFAAGLVVFLVLLFVSPRGFILILDHANLLFHEAGHPIVGLFSSRLEPYSGTIGQLVFPCVLAVSYWRKCNPLAFGAAIIWFCENLLNIAHYMADARTMALPLVGGGDHDWNTILGRWHLLAFDTRIASAIAIAAWIGISTTCAWIFYRALQGRSRVSQPDPAVGIFP